MLQKIPVIIRIFIFATDLITLDQITKYFARAYLPGSPLDLIPDFVSFTYAENSGIAWSLPVPEWALLLGIPFIIIMGGILTPRYFDYQKFLTQYLFAAVLAGALSNYIDRLIFGHVVDFISVWRWPVFNLADVYITCAVFLVIVFYGKIERNLSPK